MLSKNYYSGFDSSGRYDGTKKYYHAFETKMDDAFEPEPPLALNFQYEKPVAVPYRTMTMPDPPAFR